jgi:competence ComEA-like helix-hairpin-helix protein
LQGGIFESWFEVQEPDIPHFEPDLPSDSTEIPVRVPDGPTIDLNRASSDELTRLPGIGRARAESILRAREERGEFAAIEELEDLLPSRLVNDLRSLLE